MASHKVLWMRWSCGLEKSTLRKIRWPESSSTWKAPWADFSREQRSLAGPSTAHPVLDLGSQHPMGRPPNSLHGGIKTHMS